MFIVPCLQSVTQLQTPSTETELKLIPCVRQQELISHSRLNS
uniref:Uncharacterized protein n=1 Tax=Anguilla anguilla TaxID=7936 RepID=A0A0E9QM11_ANGAN